MTRSPDQLEDLRQRLVVGDPTTPTGSDTLALAYDAMPRRNRDTRTAWERDLDRIRYTREFQRLGGVTQVASPRGDHQLHDRLTHSLKVAQIGTRLAQSVPVPTGAWQVAMGAEAAVGEDTIDELCRSGESASYPGISWHQLREGFEGNAQSLRIAAKLARRGGLSGEVRLDLTIASLNAIIKYPWERHDEERDDEHLAAHAAIIAARPEMRDKTARKRGVYPTEVSAFKMIRTVEGNGGAWPDVCPWPSLEASFMEMADDITYAVHDLFDFFRAGAVPLAAFLAGDDTTENEVRETIAKELVRDGRDYASALALVHRAARNVADQLRRPMSDLDNADARVAEAAIADATSSIIGWLVRHVTYVQRATGTWNAEWSSTPAREAVEALHALTARFVIKSPALGLLQAGQQRMLTDIFVALVADATKSKSPRLLPVEWRGRLSRDGDGLYAADIELTRAVRDYVAGLSESGAATLHTLVTGQQAASPFAGTFRYGIV